MSVFFMSSKWLCFKKEKNDVVNVDDAHVHQVSFHELLFV